MAVTVKHKRGDTIDWPATYKIGGVATSLSTTNVDCQIKDENDVLIETPIITLLDQGLYPGQYTISVSATNTALWPIGNLKIDIQYTDSLGKVTSTDTFTIKVIKDITIL